MLKSKATPPFSKHNMQMLRSTDFKQYMSTHANRNTVFVNGFNGSTNFVNATQAQGYESLSTVEEN